MDWLKILNGILQRGFREFIRIDVPFLHEFFYIIWFCATKEWDLQSDIHDFLEFIEAEVERGIKDETELFHSFRMV